MAGDLENVAIHRFYGVRVISIFNLTEYLSLWDSSSFIETSTIEYCSESLKEFEGGSVFIFTHSYHHTMRHVMNTSCGSLNHWLYLHNTDEVLSNPNTIDSGTAIATVEHQ